MTKDEFLQKLKALNPCEKPLVEKPFAATETSYRNAMKEARERLQQGSYKGLESLFVFGSKIRRPGISDLDTGVVLNENDPVETLLTLESLLLSDSRGRFFFHRPGLVVNRELSTQLSRLMPIFGEPEVIFGDLAAQGSMPESEKWYLRFISLMNYLALTGVSEPFELWAGPTVSVRLALAKFASLRHAKSVFDHLKFPFPSIAVELLAWTEERCEDWREDLAEENAREQLIHGTYLWFLSLTEIIQILRERIGTIFDNSEGQLKCSGQLSELRPLSVNWSEETAADLTIASLKAGMSSIVTIPPEIAAIFIFYRQNCGLALGAHTYGRLFYPHVIRPIENEFLEVLKRQLEAFEQQIAFLNRLQIPYGVFHPYGVYFSASAPINPWVFRKSEPPPPSIGDKLKRRLQLWK